jgi:hypothetical protein
MLGLCTTGDKAHIDMILNFLPHTPKKCIDILIHTIASSSGRNVKYDKKKLPGGKKFGWFLLSVQVS